MQERKGRRPAAEDLRGLIGGRGIVMAPGVFSPVVAQLAAGAGFKALYFSGGGYSNLLGLPDLGATTLTEVADAVRHITSSVRLPLIVDADTGFGESINVMRTVWELERAGAAAIHIEDQVMPKRCGHLSGKQLVSIEEMVKKLIAAKEAGEEEEEGGPLLIARTDARAVEGFDAAVERSRTYLRAGAETIFPEALESEDEFSEFARKVRAPLLANMTEFGKTPYITAKRFEEMGYRMVIFPMTAFRAMLKSVNDVLRELSLRGTQEGLVDRLMTRREVYDFTDYDRYESLDRRTLSRARKFVKTD